MTDYSQHATCRWAGSTSPRLLLTHLRDCNTSGCPGCQPCTERHCQLCGRHHVTVDGRGHDLTCARCLGDARQDLGHIGQGRALLIEAILRGVNSEAAMLAGPAAHPVIFSNRLVDSRAGRAPAPWIDEDNLDERHPAWVLGTWEMLVREHLGQPAVEKVTISAAGAYLNHHLSRLAHDPEFPFEELAADLRSCRGHLEDVLAESTRPDTGAPCPVCGKANLVKDYGQAADDDVMWHCPKCENWWSDEDYRTKVCGVYVGLADRLTASQISAQYQVSESTVRTWAERGKVRRRGRDQTGRLLYDVADIITARDARSANAKTGA
jgi:transposase-like protein